MSKPVLGRNLGSLLAGEASKEVNPSLLQGNRPAATPDSEPPQPIATPEPAPAVAADVLEVPKAPTPGSQKGEVAEPNKLAKAETVSNAVSTTQAAPASGPSIYRRPAPPPLPPKPASQPIPRWYWLAADIVLIAFALLILYKSERPLPFIKGTIAVSAIVLGAGFALVALKPPTE